MTMSKAIDLTGQRYGRLTVEKRDFARSHGIYWMCRCDCGNRKSVHAGNLRSGSTKSCGCLHDENSKKTKWKTHGESGTKLYRVWQTMRARCYKTYDDRYNNYGGRGIEVCAEWRNSFEPFRDWALANGYREGLTIDRIDVNGNYEPSNCRWITNKEQQNNRTNNLLLTYNGKTQTLTQWAEETGINEMALRSRIKKLKWPVERALTEPINVNGSAK